MANTTDSDAVYSCDLKDPDNIFRRFKVIEFPISLVGLATKKELDLGMSLTSSVYLKTIFAGQLMKFDDARQVSGAHRAFNLCPLNERTIEITFKPIIECIASLKKHRFTENKFIFDLRLIKVDDYRCCNAEHHAEFGRYYISGEYEYCNLTHNPNVLNFGEIDLMTKKIKHLRIRNDSKHIAVKMFYLKSTGYTIEPYKFTISPSSSKLVTVTIKPSGLKMKKGVTFSVRNAHDTTDEESNDKDDNYVAYTVKTEMTIIMCTKKPREILVESLHKLIEPNPKVTYLGEELTKHNKKKVIALNLFTASKLCRRKDKPKEHKNTGKEICYSNSSFKRMVPEKFCQKTRQNIKACDIFDILIFPFFLDFGVIGINSFGELDVELSNNSKFDVAFCFQADQYISYTDEKLTSITIQLKSLSKVNLTILCYGDILGKFFGTFSYSIDNKFQLKHPYKLQVSNTRLMIRDTALKFGMVTSDTFVTSVPLKLYNSFNVSVDFEWDQMQPDTSFEIIPSSGCVPGRSCKICDILYKSTTCTPTKNKVHEVELISKGTVPRVIPLELAIVTRKLAVKFLQGAVLFKEIALNLKTVERVKLENSSREIAVFHVVEPLLLGVTVEPMAGILRPKTILFIDIEVKIACVLEFTFDLTVKINNKENVCLPVSGSVIEPKLVIQPKLIAMPRVPCNLITFVPVSIQNLCSIKTEIEVMDTGDENIFEVYVSQGYEKHRVFNFIVEGSQTKTVFIKVFDTFRREYDMYIPFKINGLLGPPNFEDSSTTEMAHYTGEFEKSYECNAKVKVKYTNKDISFCHIFGIITVAWIEFSMDKYEFNYVPGYSNQMNVTMKNVSRYFLPVTISTSKLLPYFSLQVETENNQSIVNESHIKFELHVGCQATLTIKFHPKGHGRFFAIAPLYLDRSLNIAYNNLTFIGTRQTPVMTSDTQRVVFPPCLVGVEMKYTIKIDVEIDSDLEPFTCSSKEEENLLIKFMKYKTYHKDGIDHTRIYVMIRVCCYKPYSRTMTLTFHHECGSSCDLEVSFSYTYCPLTLHTQNIVDINDSPYPYYPSSEQKVLYEYLENCTSFLEKWLFQQGFRRDLFPTIPDTFHATSSTISSPSTLKQAKSINVTFLNFMKRVAGPFMKHIKKNPAHGLDENFRYVKEIHDVYRDIVNLLRTRGNSLWTLQPKFLLSYDQFVVYAEMVPLNCNADIILVKELIDHPKIFERLNKQSWLDFILQTYKAFVMDSCFFDCVCVSDEPRDIIRVLADWYNLNIQVMHHQLHASAEIKVITNLTTDLSDGVAIISAILQHCPYLEKHFSHFHDIDENDKEGSIIHNACLIVEAMSHLRMYFPISSIDFLQPNYVQMLFLSIHLYVTLPMYRVRDTITLSPPLLRSSSRLLSVSPTTQESLIINHTILNSDSQYNFTIEKVPDAGKKLFLSIKYTANFVDRTQYILLIHGYNKTRVFDTYMVFKLIGEISSLNPTRKCKVTGPLYRPIRVDAPVSSPFLVSATFHLYQTEVEPSIPVKFEESNKKRFFVRRLNLIDNEISMPSMPKDSDGTEIKIYFQMTCLSMQVTYTWVWFRSDVGDFFIKVTAHARGDLGIDTIHLSVKTWPLDPCSCGEACECYRTSVIVIPHRNELVVKALRFVLSEYASDLMLQIFDILIESATGRVILRILFSESGTMISDISHILRESIIYRITSKNLKPQQDRVTLLHHSNGLFVLPITVPSRDKSEKFSIVFTSDCGMDIRTYRILFVPEVSDYYSSP